MRVSTLYCGIVVAAATILVLLSTQYILKSGVSRKKKIKVYDRSVDFVCSHNRSEPFVEGVQFLLYILCHDEKSLNIAKKWSKCMPWAQTVLVPSTVYFESAAYSSVFPNLEAEWSGMDVIGVSTYKSLKFLNIEKLKAYVELAHFRPYDVVPLYTSGEYLVPQAVKGHTQEFQSVWEAVLQRVSLLPVSEIRRFDRIEVFFRNTFIISPKWLRKVNEFMTHAMKTVKSDPQLYRLLSSDAHYAEGKLPVARSVFHKDYYEWFPFIFERLPCFYLHHAGARVFQTLRQVSSFENNEEGMSTLYKGL